MSSIKRVDSPQKWIFVANTPRRADYLMRVGIEKPLILLNVINILILPRILVGFYKILLHLTSRFNHKKNVIKVVVVPKIRSLNFI